MKELAQQNKLHVNPNSEKRVGTLAQVLTLLVFLLTMQLVRGYIQVSMIRPSPAFAID